MLTLLIFSVHNPIPVINGGYKWIILRNEKVVTILVVEQNPLDFTWCHEKDKACVEMVEEGLANGTILPPTHCNPRCSQQEFEVTNLKEKSKKSHYYANVESRVLLFIIRLMLVLPSGHTRSTLPNLQKNPG